MCAELTVLFRKPKFPVIIIFNDNLFAAASLPALAKTLAKSAPPQANGRILVIDSTGEEFWYSPAQAGIAPGFLSRRWTKKRIIGLFNSNADSKQAGVTYPGGSLSNKTLPKIVKEIAALVSRREPR